MFLVLSCSCLCPIHWSQVQCATFPIHRGPDLGKNWVRLGKQSILVTRQSMVISCVLLDDSITGLQVYTVGLWWIILTLDRWSMTSENLFRTLQVLSWEWRWGLSSADRWCSNYIWVINNFIAYQSVSYIRGLMVLPEAEGGRLGLVVRY